jgi:hypothetical protein
LLKAELVPSSIAGGAVGDIPFVKIISAPVSRVLQGRIRVLDHSAGHIGTGDEKDVIVSTPLEEQDDVQFYPVRPVPTVTVAPTTERRLLEPCPDVVTAKLTV